MNVWSKSFIFIALMAGIAIQGAEVNLAAALAYEENDDEDADTTTQKQIPEELTRLAQQTPEQTAQADTLRNAIDGGNIDAIKALLASKADVNARTSANSSALHVPIVFYRPDIVQLLLMHNASTNSIDSQKRTPLHIWCAGIAEPSDETTQSLRLLLNAGAHVNAQDDSQDTPLSHLEPLSDLYFGPKEDYAPLLLEWGANPNIYCGAGRDTLDSVRYKLGLDTYTELRAPLCKIILSLDAHRKKLDATTAAIQSVPQFPLGGKDSTDRIVVEYLYGSSRPDDKKLDGLLKDFADLLQEFHTHGQYGTYSTQCNTD